MERLEGLLKEALKEVRILKKTKRKEFDYSSLIQDVLSISEIELDFKTELALTEIIRQEVPPEKLVLLEGEYNDDNDLHCEVKKLAYFDNYYQISSSGEIDTIGDSGVKVDSNEQFLIHLEAYFTESDLSSLIDIFMLRVFKAALEGKIELPVKEADFSNLEI